jgi:hypothetical protein
MTATDCRALAEMVAAICPSNMSIRQPMSADARPQARGYQGLSPWASKPSCHPVVLSLLASARVLSKSLVCLLSQLVFAPSRSELLDALWLSITREAGYCGDSAELFFLFRLFIRFNHNVCLIPVNS